jgi:long-chain acyl-CoA synthetase
MIHTELIRPIPRLLAAHALERGGKRAFRDDRRDLDYEALFVRTGRLAGHLRGLGITPGARAAIYMDNRVEAVESYLAIPRAGGIGVFVNPAAAEGEVAHMLEDAGARVLLTDTEHLERAARLARAVPALEHVVVVDGASGTLAYEDLVGSEPERPAPDDLELDAPAWMLYTSGTTGRPKGVLLSQRSCLWVVAACWAPIVGLDPDDYVLSGLPLFHSYALDLAVLGVVATGASEYLLPRFSTRRVRELLPTEPITLFPGVPTMFHYLLESLGGERLDAPSLRVCVSAGAIMPATVNEDFERAAGVPLLDGYGITETSTMVTMNWRTGGRPRSSCGLPLPGSSVRIVDPVTESDVLPGSEGEVWVRGPHVMLGYHNRPSATADALRDGWYRTGDLGRAEEHGYLTITGRIKELIIRGGENIYPAEVEAVLADDPVVLDCAVVGMPHRALGEVPVAFVVPREGERLDPDALQAQCRARLASFKVPAAVRAVDEIPRTGSGKIMRHRLQELLPGAA